MPAFAGLAFRPDSRFCQDDWINPAIPEQLLRDHPSVKGDQKALFWTPII
jgi:hypothetical protein